MLQRHIAMARVRPDLAKPGSEVSLEFTVNHHYEYVRPQHAPGCRSTTQTGRRPDMTKTAPIKTPPDRHRGRRSRRSRPKASERTYDAIVIGGGHNGLVNGAYLAKSGLKTLILERRPLVGRRRHHRGAPPRLLVHDVLVRAQPAAARHHPRAGADQARLHAAADVLDLRADGERRLPVARRRTTTRTSRRSRATRSTTPTRTSSTRTTWRWSARRSSRCSTWSRRTSSATIPRSCSRSRRSARGSGRWTSASSTTWSGC